MIYVKTTHLKPQSPAIDSYMVHMSAQPFPDFTIDTIIPGNPVAVHLKDKTTIREGFISCWYWDFSDGQHSIDSCPVAYYSSTGSYDVSLKSISDAGCENTIIKTAFIIIDSTNLGIPVRQPVCRVGITSLNGNMTISISANEEIRGMNILNINGQEIKRPAIRAGKNIEAYVSGLKHGMYLIQVVFQDQSIIFKEFYEF